MKISQWREVLNILSHYSLEGEEADFLAGAEHDVVYLAATDEEIPPDSWGGKRLQELGCQPNIEGYEAWGKYV